jgi:hypothetical protein
VVGLAVLLASGSVQAVATPEAVEDPRRKAVEELIYRYFRTWSNEDMAGYRECFHKSACIQYMDDKGGIDLKALPAFLASQAAVFRAKGRGTETPESIEIRFERELARAVVYWKLTTERDTFYGYDHFTLVRKDGRWVVVNLVFYDIDKEAKP